MKTNGALRAIFPAAILAALAVWALLVRLEIVQFAPIGTYIGILAFAGVVVTFWLPEEPWAKACWIVILASLLIFEIRNLYHDRDEHDKAQRELQQSFKVIADQINGGDSFVYLKPVKIGDAIALTALVHGEYVVRQVQYNISDTAPQSYLDVIGYRLLGDVTPDVAVPLLNLNRIPATPGQTHHLNVNIVALNGVFNEKLAFTIMSNGEPSYCIKVSKRKSGTSNENPVIYTEGCAYQ